jgi:acyl-CoA reductase-like NAD-dependent aldehyde dehydrogenase
MCGLNEGAMPMREASVDPVAATGRRQRAAGARIEAGIVVVKCIDAGDPNTRLGGVELCGFGLDKSRHALEKFTDLETTWIKHA